MVRGANPQRPDIGSKLDELALPTRRLEDQLPSLAKDQGTLEQPWPYPVSRVKAVSHDPNQSTPFLDTNADKAYDNG